MANVPRNSGVNWLRITLEGVVIIVSILLAFGIDAAWGRHVERSEEAEIRADLTAEIGQNLQVLDRLTASHQRIIDNAARLVATPGSELLAMSEAEVSPFFYVLLSRVSFTPVDGTLESALSSGKLHRIQSDSIRNGLVTWRGLARDTEEEIQELRQATRDIVEHARGKGMLAVAAQYIDRGIGEVLVADGRTMPEVLADLMRDPVFVDLVLWKADSHWEYVNELRRLRDLLVEINEQLGRGE